MCFIYPVDCKVPRSEITHRVCNRVLTKPEHIKNVFKDSDKHEKAVNNDSGYLMSRVLGKCVGLISGEEWKRLRAVSGAAFTQRNIVCHVETIYRRAIDYLDGCEQTGRLCNHLLDPVEDLKMLPFLTVADVIYGKLSPAMEQELRQMAPIHERLFKHVIRGGLSRFWVSKYLPTEANRLLSDFENKWVAFNHSAYQRAFALGLVETPIFSLFRSLEEKSIDPEHVHHTLDEALYANLDVTMGGLSWNLVFLAADQDAQKMLREEVKNARQKSNIHQYLLSSKTFLAACIAESSRLKPLAAFSVPQSAPTDRIIDGYRIPAKTNFVIDTYAINILNSFWGTDAHEYRPTRFLEVNNAEARYNFWRFGFGPRQCMGRYVADVTIRALLVELIDRWELHLPKELEGREWERDADAWITHPRMQLSCTPVS